MILSHPPRTLPYCLSNVAALRAANNRTGWAALALGFGLLGALSSVAFAAKKITVKLEGDIATECGIGSAVGASAFGTSIILDDISKSSRQTFDFVVNCNAPFEYRLEAQYGALKHVGERGAPSGFTTAVPYDVAVYIPTNNGAINDRCSGENIRASHANCQFSNSGDAIALGSQGSFTVEVRPGDGAPLAGEYFDKVTITVAAQQ